MDITNTEKALHQVGALLEEKLKQQMLVDRTSSLRNGGDTYKSIKYHKVGELVYVEAAQSFKFVDEGRGPGKYPPLAEIETWIKSKGLRPRSDAGFVKMTPKTMKRMTFARRGAIGKYGTIKRFQYNGSQVKKRVYKTNKDKVFNLISDGMLLDIQAEINKATKQ